MRLSDVGRYEVSDHAGRYQRDISDRLSLQAGCQADAATSAFCSAYRCFDVRLCRLSSREISLPGG